MRRFWSSVAAVLFYLVAYLIIDIARVRDCLYANRLQELITYRGLIQRSPVGRRARLFLCLLGVPRPGGFAARFQIFQVLFDTGQIYGNSAVSAYHVRLAGHRRKTAISLVYYVRVIKIMVIDSPDQESAQPIAWTFPVRSVVYASVLRIAAVLGILWDPAGSLQLGHTDSPNQAPGRHRLRAPENEIE